MTPTVGRRIVVYGWAGSGKTAASRRIGAALGLPVIELDALFWRPRWQPSPVDEFRAAVLGALAACPDGWVCDGNYAMIRGDILPLADTAVWLRLPFRTAYWRLVKRTVGRALKQEPLWHDNRESFSSRVSLLLSEIKQWGLGQRGLIQDFQDVPHRAAIVELRSPREVEAFLRHLEAPASPSPMPG